MDNKKQLVKDIQNLLNTYEGVHETQIDPKLLDFMDEETLKNIISSLLYQKEDAKEADTEWLNKFKQDKSCD